MNGAPATKRTAWARNLETPLRTFLRTETASAAFLLAGTVAALAWVNLDSSSYEGVWDTRLAVELGDSGVAQSLRDWVNNGLMTFFFFIVGLEARREYDMGELRDRRRLALPLTAGIAGMAAAVAIYLALNAGTSSAHGWGVAMSTDTAFALGALALVGPGFPRRLRAFLLTVVVVDDIVALLVIALVYSEDVTVAPLAIAAAIFAGMLGLRAARVRCALPYALLCAAAWVALFESGIEPAVIGLAAGLITFAYPASRLDLEHATDLFRLFREQPTPELARTAQSGVAAAISPNERLQQLFHPWTSYLVVPLFALANAGIVIDSELVSRAVSSPITVGIVAGYLLGKPVGITGGAWLVSRLTGGRVRPPLGWAAVLGAATIAGIGFTLSLLIATLAFDGPALEEAKAGILVAGVGACVTTLLVARVTAMLPRRRRAVALLGTADLIVDLAAPVDPDRDHIRGPAESEVTLLEYGDLECPYCGQAEPAVRELLAEFGDVRYVWRHLPLNDVHPHAQMAAEATEAAAEQGAFWELHDLLLAHQDALTFRDLIGYAERLGLDMERFRNDITRRVGSARIAADVDSADLSGVSGTPTFFVNERRLQGAYDVDSLARAVRGAGARAAIKGAATGAR